MKKRVRYRELAKKCPRCGGAWVRISGFLRCKTCSHISGSQHPEEITLYSSGRYVFNRPILGLNKREPE
jgi:hypothetical protein